MARSVKALITPEVLKWAREKRIGLTLDSAAGKLKIDPERLKVWEDGTDRPTFAQLKKIARVYKTALSLFYLPAPPMDFQKPTDYRVLPGPSDVDEEQRYRLNANILEVLERRETLIDLYELLEEPLPEITLYVEEHEAPKQVARKIAEFLGFKRKQLRGAKDPYTALKFWKKTIEAQGILACQTSANSHLSVSLETIRGFCIAERPFPVIVVNPKDSPYGRIFTLIHELVHILLGKSVMQNTGIESLDCPELNSIEIFCNQVAAEVLVPKKELLKTVKLQTLVDDLPRLSKAFHVSPEVIMRRLLTFGAISKHDYENYRNNQLVKYRNIPAKTGGFAHYPHRLLNASGEHFARTAFAAYHKDKITLSELASVFSNCDTKHLTEIESSISNESAV